MSFLSPKFYHGLNAALFVAYHGSKDAPVSGAQISTHYNLSPRAFETALQMLGKAGYLQSVRGQSGGYYVQSPEHVNLRDIWGVFVGDLFPVQNGGPFAEFFPLIQDVLEDAHYKMLLDMQDITLKNLCERAERQGVSMLLTDILDFTI